MAFLETPIRGLFLFEPNIYRDERGYFTEAYNDKVFGAQGILTNFVQDNQAASAYGVIRGLHYQRGRHAQAKLVRVILGEVLDVVVDLRLGSPSYGQSYSVILSDQNFRQLYIPKGFAHGYSVLSEQAIFFYKCDAYYNRESEGGIHPLDESLNIDWQIPKQAQIISDKDLHLPHFNHHLPVNL